MKRSKSSKGWLKEHFSDVYVKRAKEEGFRARSVYKLIEIQERYKIIKPKMLVVDLGAAPGGWSEYVASIVGMDGKVLALDVLSMQPLKGVELICGDFTKDEVVEELHKNLNRQKIDVVLSDMAPNLSGLRVIDQANSMNLAEKALIFAQMVLKPGGVFLTKIFQGVDFNLFLKKLHYNFGEIKIIKPEASRARSNEIFVLAKKFSKNIPS